MKKINLINLKFGRLTVLKQGETVGMHIYWYCECDCGNHKSVASRHLRSGRTMSCGCLQEEAIRTHGMTDTPEYSVWSGMHQRCTNHNNLQYKDYGGRGISVCKEWDSFLTFFKDMSYRPSINHTLERINNDLGYYADNCKWATRLEQAQNRRVRKTAKLTKKIADKIRSLYSSPNHRSQESLGKEFGVSHSNVSRIINGSIWK